MSHSIHLAAVHAVPCARVRAVIERRLAENGFEIVRDEARAGARSLLLRKFGKWCALVGTDDPSTSVSDWASLLSAELEAPVLALFLEDGEASVVARRFENREEAASLELPRQAKRGKDRRARAPADVLMPWISSEKRRTLRGTLVLDRGPSELEEAHDPHPFVDLEDSGTAIARAIGLPSSWLRPAHVEVGAKDEVIAYRPAGMRTGLPVLPPVPPLEAGYEERIDANVRAYRGRGFAVGWIACDERYDLPPLLSSVSSLVRRFCPDTGLNVRVHRGGASQTFPGRFTTNSQLSEAQLAKGGLVALSRNEAFSSVDPLFWVSGDPQGVRLVMGWCIPRTEEPARNKAIADVMCSVIESAVASEGCIAALLTAQGSSWSFGGLSFPYERLAHTYAGATDTAWLRTHVRTPGWRVLVPRDALGKLSKKLPSGVSAKRVASGLLLGVEVETPFAMGDIEGLERLLLPIVGSLEDFPHTYAPWLSH